MWRNYCSKQCIITRDNNIRLEMYRDSRNKVSVLRDIDAGVTTVATL